jgi:hypothetical protein
VYQSGNANGVVITSTNAGAQTDSVSITRTNASGSTTNLLNVFNNGGTVTNAISVGGVVSNGISFGASVSTLLTSANFNVTQAGAITAVGVNSGTGLLQGTGGLTLTGATAINTTGTANTSIGNATGTLTLTGATTLAGTFSQTGANTFSTGTGAISLNGATSVTGTNTLTVGTGLTSLGGGLSVTSGTTTLSGDLLANGNTTLGNATTDRLTVTSQILGGSPLVFQGATDNANTTTFAFTEPTGVRTQTFQDNSGIVPLSTAGNTLFFTTSGATTLTLPTSGTLTVNPASGSYIQQVPTTSAANTITPTTNSVIGLTVNGTSGTAATAASIVQGGAALGLNITSSSTGDGQNINLTNTAGTQTNGLAITRNGAGGTTTNLLNLTNTAGTVTNAINLSGTYTDGIDFTGATTTNLINSSSFVVNNAGYITNNNINGGITFSDTSNTVFSVDNNTNAIVIGNTTAGSTSINAPGTGAINLQGITNINVSNSRATNINTGTATGAVTIGNNGSVNNTVTIVAGSTGGINLNSATIATNQTSVNLLNTTATTVNAFGAATTLSLGASSGTTTVNNGLTVAGATLLNGNTTIGNASSDTVTFTAQANSNLTFANGANRTISIATQTTSNTAGNNLIVQAATGNGTGVGGNLVLNAGTGGSADGNGGNLTISGGAYGGSAGNGGNITIAAGDGDGLGGTGGNVSINAGNGDGKGQILIGGSTAGTVSIGSAASTSYSEILSPTVNINTGAASSNVTTIGGLSATINLNASTIATARTSLDLLNTTVTSINAFGATTALNLGATTGTTTIRNSIQVNGNTSIGDVTTDRLTVTSQILGGSPLVFQGATDNGFTTTLAVTDPTANNTITLPDASGTVQLAPTSGSFIKQVPASTAENTITPTANSVVGLTVNGTSGTSAQSAIFNQSGNADNVWITSTNTGTQTDGLYINRNNAGGTTTNLLALENTAGTVTNGINFAGTYTNLINATNFSVTNAGALTAVGVNSGTGLLQGTGGLTLTGATSINASGANTTNIGTGTNTGAITIGNASNAANTVTIVAGATNGIALNAPLVTTNATTIALFNTTATTVNAFGAATSINMGANTAGGTTTLTTPNVVLGNTTNRGTVTNNGGTINSTLAVADDANGGVLGGGLTAAQSVDIYTSISVAQTTASQTITLPTPTANTTYGRIVYLSNIGTTSFTFGTTTINPGTTATLIWSNTNGGASWQFAGADGNGILNQNTADQSANFRISGTGRANTSFTAPLFDSISGALGIGTSTATGVTIGGTTNTTAITLQGATAATYDIGTTTGTGQITIGKSTAGNTISVGSAATINAQVVDIANGTVTTGASTVRILSGSAGSSGTATLLLGNSDRVTQIDIGNVAADAARTINLGTGNNTVGVDTINIGSGNTTVAGGKTINIGTGTPSGSGTNIITIGTTATAGSSVTLAAGSTGFVNFNATQAQFTEVTGTRTLTVQTRTTNVAGSNLTVQAGAAGTGASAFAGGTLTLQGGTAAGTGNANGGNVALVGGTATGSGSKGLVVIDTATYATAASQSSAVDANITQANIDAYGAIILNATAADVEFTLSAPTLGASAAGRLIYVTAANGSSDFTLRANVGGGTGVEQNISMRQNTTATMIWNGSQWTAAGASSSTTLQAAYDNTLSSAGGAEIVLNNTATANGLTVRNNATNPIIGGIFETQTSIGSNLFSVNNNATEFATNGGAETLGASASTFPANTWDTTTGGTVDRFTTTGDNVATGAASVRVQTTTTNHGARNRISASLTTGLTYSVSFAVRGASNFSTLQILYSPDGTTTGTTTCDTAQTVTSGIWTRITCTFVASGTITSSNSILIRQTDATARTFYIDNLSVNINASATYAADGSADNAGAFGTNWGNYAASGTATVSRDTTTIYDTSASAEVNISTATAGIGIRNNLGITPQINTQYLVSFYAYSSTTMTGTLAVGFLPAGGTGAPTGTAACTDYNTQSLVANTWTKITCLFTTTATAISNPDVVIYQTDAAIRIINVDALTVTLNTNNSNNVQVGGANKGGPTTLFTLDRSDSAPIAANNEAYLGSMYYDTTTGRIQCYEADGWGACGSAPDNFVNLNPEYSGAVLNGTGVGTMTADLCADQSGVLQVNDTLCGTGEAKNFYKWTSPQATQQTYSIYVSYQLPSTFKGFSSDDTVQLTALVDNTTNAAVTYEMFRSEGGSLVKCGTGETAVTTSANTWQTVGINGNESTGCGFTTSSAGAFVIFKINVKANSGANAYVSTLSFTTTGR